MVFFVRARESPAEVVRWAWNRFRWVSLGEPLGQLNPHALVDDPQPSKYPGVPVAARRTGYDGCVEGLIA